MFPSEDDGSHMFKLVPKKDFNANSIRLTQKMEFTYASPYP